MKYVYLIHRISYPKEKYIGITSDLKDRLKVHNEGGSPHTLKFKPWKLVTYLAFSSEEQAREFESYLETRFGTAFAKFHNGL